MKPNSNNRSGLKGAFLAGPKGKWMSRLYVRGRYLYLGHCFSPEEANRIYCKARDSLPFATLRIE